MENAPERASRRDNWRLVILLLLLGGLLILAVRILVPYFYEDIPARSDAGRIAKAQLDFRALRAASMMFRLEHGRWPTHIEEFLDGPPGPEGQPIQYLEKLPRDPWGEVYGMRATPEGAPEFFSLGADRAPGGEGVAADLSSAE